MIRVMQDTDWQSVKSIYIEGILTNNATFEQPENIKDFEDWIKSKIPMACFVAEDQQQILAWSSLSPVSSRCVYAGVAEVSVYIASASSGRGWGKKMLQSLIDYAEQHNIWTLQASIFPENEASIALHKKLGFRAVGYREKIAKQNGHWRNTIFFERRSTTIL